MFGVVMKDHNYLAESSQILAEKIKTADIIKLKGGDVTKFKKEKMNNIVTEIAQYEIFSENFLNNYFSTLKFDLNESFQTGLNKYYQMAKEIGAIEAVPKLRFVKI